MQVVQLPLEKNPNFLCRKLLKFSWESSIIYERDCERYAMKREVAAESMPVFPWSMSDFKPGEK